jgi:hypothetical protein
MHKHNTLNRSCHSRSINKLKTFSSCCVQNVGLQRPEQVNIADIKRRTRTSAVLGVHITSVSCILPSVTVVSDNIQMACKEDAAVSNRTCQSAGLHVDAVGPGFNVLLAEYVA